MSGSLRAIATAVLAILLAACSGSASLESSSANPASVSSAAPTSEASESGAATPEPAEATASPQPAGDQGAEPVISQTFFKTWQDSIGTAHYQAILEVSNPTNGSVVDVSGGSQDYTIYDKSGSVITTGSFNYAWPPKIGPGAKSYLIDSGIFDEGTKLKNVGKFEPSTSWSTEASGDPTELFPVSNVKVSAAPYEEGLQVSAVVKNNTNKNADQAVAGFVFFNADGKIIGGLYDNTVDQIFAGKSKGVKTSYPGTPPLKPSAVKKTISVAYDFSFF